MYLKNELTVDSSAARGVSALRLPKDQIEQMSDFSVNHDCVESLFTAEVLIDDRLADLGAVCDLLYRGRFISSFSEHLSADNYQLLTALLGGHSYTADRGIPHSAR